MDGSATASEAEMLFVYGTLRRGGRFQGVLRRLRARLLAEGSVAGSLYHLGDYPGAIQNETAASSVRGEVYLLSNPARALKVLDNFEGFNPGRPEASLFLRERTTVTLASGRRVQAWIYWLREVRGRKRRVPLGEYRRAKT